MSRPCARPTTREHAVARLAPELVLHILSFLGHRDHPSRLLPILTLCKSWARLALELIYDQPVLTLHNLESFITTLQLQDRLQNGQLPFWDANYSTADSYVGDARTSLGIDYRAMIKKPCRIVGCAGYPTKEDLTQLWDLQTLLWTAPIFSEKISPSGNTLEQDSIASSPPSPPSSGNSSRPESSHISAPPSPTSPTLSSSSSMDSPFPTTPRSNSPVQIPSKIVLVRRKKKVAPPPGPVVILLELSLAFTDTMLYILRKVPGMALRKIHYRSLLDASLMEIVEKQLPYLNEIVLSRPPGRPDDFIAFAQHLSNSKRLAALKFDQCAGVGATLLSTFAHACGDSLKTLQIHQPASFRLQGPHSFFPVDGPEDWNNNLSTRMAHIELESASRLYPSLAPEQSCSRCGLLELSSENPTSGAESEVESLGISEGEGVAPVEEDPAPLPIHENTLAQADPESMMDLAMLAFADNCPRLAHLVLNRLTWLSDSGLAGFKPPETRSRQPASIQPVLGRERWRGLSSISILDSNYGSTLTLEGVLDLCGSDLEALVIDRKSCWKRRQDHHRDGGVAGLCVCCQRKEWKEQTRLNYLSTGDRLIWGLLHKPSPESVRHLQELVLVEHWVSVELLKAAMERWLLTLRVLSLRLFKCSDEEQLRRY
ncbi:hypothetical protein EC968_004914 [Mortierella alpina]|nr:hypothetical protein EC968_004914 [Mortierella alpina]